MFEKKRGKRFLASVMALVMLLSLAPVGALAADEPPTTEESPAVAQSAVEGKDQQAEGKDQQAAVDEDKNTPTEDSDSAEATKLEGDFDESFSNADTSDNDNRIAAQNLSLNEPTQEQSITAEYWVTNSKVEVSGQNSKTISVAELEEYGEEGVDIEEFAPPTGTQDANNAIFWQARVLTTTDSNNQDVYVQDYQSNVPDINCTGKGEELTKIRVANNQIQYQTKQSGSEWKKVEFTASWNPSTNTAYTVKHFLQNLDGSYPTEAYETETKSGTTGENTAATAKSYTGFTVQNFEQKTIAANGSTVVEIKYERNKHNITYQITGDYFVNGSYTTVENVPFGSTLSLISDNMAQDGYTFSEWSGLPETMPDNDVTVTGSYTKNDVGPVDPPTAPDTELVDAMYFVLMPGQGVPNSGVSQGVDKYFPNASNNGGVEGRNNTNGYVGKITKAATELKGAQTTNGYFQVNGVDPNGEYLKNIGDLGYFKAANYNADGTYKGTLPTGMANFNMTNKSIVWYVIKKEGDVYHVDGYVKGVKIELKYFDEFDVKQMGESTRLLSGGTATIKNPDVTHDGWKFAGWFTKDGTKYEVNSTHTLIDSLNLYARWTTTYSVVTHFMDANGIEQEKLSQTRNDLTGTHGKLLSELVVQPNITGNYVYVPSETSYSVGKVDKGKVGDATFTEANTVIHQYYYLDETGKTGKDEENKPTDKPDGIPDAWQYKVTFKVVNGKWNDHDNSDNIVVYVNAKDKDGKTLDSKLTATQIPAVGEKPNSGYRASGSWDKSLSADLKITGDTEFTFTYSRRSSGGSSRPSTPPTVDIPDDVPTGLNGKDHYAYIIGYGNNDVRPQNNITRAEVATIFFRLLTDETRTANMTKSNGYNDVKDGDWFCCAVSTLSKMGIIKGYEDGSFKPNDPISRAEFAAIAARFDPDGDKTPATFADVTSHWAKDEISIAANHGWIKGYEDGSFKPDQKITRAETMTLVNRVLNRLPETKDDLHKDMKTWVDNMDETAWYYLAVQEATNSHYFKNKTGTKFEQWTDLRDTRDWSELEK